LVTLEALFIYHIPRTMHSSGWQPQTSVYNSVPLEPNLNQVKPSHLKTNIKR